MPHPPLTEAELTEALATLDRWAVVDGVLGRDLVFDTFPAAMAFMLRVGFAAEQQAHHPDWTNVYNRVSVRLSTHDAGGAITAKDVGLARAIDQAARAGGVA